MMPVSAPEICEQTLPSTVYPQLSLSLAKMVPFIPGVVKLMTNTELIEIGEAKKRFTVLTSKSFSALVYDVSAQDNSEIQLTFDPNAISTFLDDLYQRCHQKPQAQQLITEVKARQARKTNDAKLQGQFTLQSLAATSSKVNPSIDSSTSQLALAIYQTQLHDQVQQQQQTLEEQVAQRTQELQSALIAAQSANQAKSDFLATMSHELRTPLTCVIGMSATLLRWSLGPLTDKQRSCLQTIHNSGEHLLELINDILDFSHVQSGKATLNVSEFSLSSLMQQILQLMRDKADAHEVQLKANLKIPPDRDRFCADLRRVQQILISLVDNAIKFTPMGGKVTLRVWVETNTVVFQVEDTGIGISPSQQPHLFEKFQQLDTSYRRTYDGAGLGLALAQQCVTLHQGWIDVSSVEGQGSIFTVQLPNQAAFVPQSKPRSTSLSGGRIVLIEGNEEDAMVLCDILTAANYQLIWMVEASAAIEQIRLLQPISVILDAQLPGQGCRSLIRRLRSLPGADKMKIIVLTPEGVSKDHQQYLSLGADAYLLKSLKPEDLLKKVEVLLKSASVI